MIMHSISLFHTLILFYSFQPAYDLHIEDAARIFEIFFLFLLLLLLLHLLL